MHSRNGRLRRPTLVNGHVMGAISKGVVFILKPNLNSLLEFSAQKVILSVSIPPRSRKAL